MAPKSAAMLRVVTGQGIIPRPNLLKRILTALDIRKTRIDLSKLSDEQLCDLGLSREQVDAEIRRSIWDAPEYFYARR